MKTIIAGSRNGIAQADFDKAIRNASLIYGFEISEVVSGGALGVDRLGEAWARANGTPIKRFLPDWSNGKVGGILRNREMAKYADALIAIWDGKSRGTRNMIDEAAKCSLRVYVHQVN